MTDASTGRAASDTALTGPVVTTSPAFLDRLSAIQAALPPADGLACFNRMYRQITTLVLGRIGAGYFTDQAYMDRLDIVFGNLYLAAVNASVTQPDQVARCWAALLDRRTDSRITPLQFALAGMNAHINHDLPIAVVTACTDLATTPDSHHADYERVNAVLAGAEQQVRRSFESEALLHMDQSLSGAADIVVNWDLVKARETAWANAEVLWSLQRSAPSLADGFLNALDNLTGFAGRGLLTPLSAGA